MSGHDPEALARYWDGLVAGQDLDSSTLDPTLAEAVRRLHTARDVEGVDPAFVRNLMEELMLSPSIAAPGYGAALPPINAEGRAVDLPRMLPNPNGRSEPRRVQAARPMIPVQLRRWLGSAASLAAAAALVLGLVGGILVLRDGPGSGGRSGSIPAVQVSPEATPEPTVIIEPEIEFTDAGVVEGLSPDPLGIGFYRLTYEPGATITFGPGESLGLAVVESGTLTLSDFSDNIMIVRAAANSPTGMQFRERLPAGSKTELGPGDAWVWPGPVGGTVSNEGTETAVVASYEIGPEA
jgi:hypothetical protein